MNIALCHFRVGETDGVSLEMDKWKYVLEKMGHNVYFISGSESLVKSQIIDSLHYNSNLNNKILKNSFEELSDFHDEELKKLILENAGSIENELFECVNKNNIDIIVPNNILSLGYNLSAAIAFNQLLNRCKSLKIIAHHHDFFWERQKYSNPTTKFIKEILATYFPIKHERVKHVVINKIAQNELKTRRDIYSTVVPNVFDFENSKWVKDQFNANFREKIGIDENDIVFLQATRIVERKGIELAIDVVSEITNNENLKTKLYNSKLYDGRKFSDKNKIYLILAGIIDNEEEYFDKLIEYAKSKNVNILHINSVIKHERELTETQKYYSLWDSYVISDFVTYPSLLEGWGNQFIEAVIAKKPILVYEYPVFEKDIKSYGFDIVSLGNSHKIKNNNLVEIDKNTIEKSAKECVELLINQDKRKHTTENNYTIGKNNFDYKNLQGLLKEILQ